MRADIRKHVGYSACPTLDDMIVRAREREIDIKKLRKRKAETEKVAGVSGIKPKGSHTWSMVQPGQGRCRKHGRPHEGVCRLGSLGCYKRGKTGHLGRDCTALTPTFQTLDLICFYCNQKGQKKAKCPRLTTAAPVAVPTPGTLRIIDGRQGKTDVPVVRIRAFQLTTEEALVTPDVLTGMISSP